MLAQDVLDRIEMLTVVYFNPNSHVWQDKQVEVHMVLAVSIWAVEAHLKLPRRVLLTQKLEPDSFHVQKQSQIV